MESCPGSAPTTAPGLPQEVVRGVSLLKPRLDRPSPYGVQWFADGRQKREFFATEADRDARHRDLLKSAKRGVLADELTRTERVAAKAFFAAIGDTPWQDVVSGWRAHRASTGKKQCTLTVRDAVAQYLAYIKGRVSKDAEGHKKHQLGLFADAFGGNRLDQVTPEAIEGWIDEFEFGAAATFNSYLKQVSALYRHFSQQTGNPCEHIDRRDDSAEVINILTVPQTAALFDFARRKRPEVLGRLALEAFAGLRFSSASRLTKQEINFEDRGILLPAHKIKTGRRHYIDGLPANLWAWVNATNDACWAMKGSEWLHSKCRVFADAGVPHPRNCLRHSFCTYHVAAYKNPGLTATILCHRGQQRLWASYNGVAKQADGLRYFTIVPENAAAIAREGA